MATVYGLTDLGFFTKPLTAIRDDLNTAFRDAFGASLSLNDRSAFGVIVGIWAERLAILWQILEQITTSLDPDKASGTLLDALSALTGTFRPAADTSKVTLTLTGIDATTVASGSLVQTLSTLKNFKTLADALISAVSAWTPSTSYALGDRVSNAGGVYQNTQAGISAGSGGPTSQDLSAVITDNTCTWTFLGLGTAAVDVDAESEDEGPIIGTAKDISHIVNTQLGWSGVTNVLDAQPGRLVAVDSELRQLRESELAAAGSSPLDALLANLEQVEGVTSVTLFPNNTDFIDVDGVPPHSIEALIKGGDDQDIFDEILRSIAAGIGTFGNTSGTSADSQGVSHAINFSRPSTLSVYANVTLSYDAAVYPADGDTQVKNALVDYVAALSTGRDITASALGAQAFLKVPGVLDVSKVLIYSDVIGAATAWAPSTGYSATVGVRSVVTNDGGRTYICITSGTSAGSGGPTGTGTDITDGGVHWRFLGNSVSITTRQLASLPFNNISVTSSSATP